MTTKRVSLSEGAAQLLREMADAEGVTTREYLEALLHFAGSCHKRPGSWEANRPFEFSTYDTRNESGNYADRWF
jgi:hypothetical protein